MKFQEFSEKLISWYKGNYRPLPWRDITDPYKIWLSEIILQQTRVMQGLPYYNKFIDKYPAVNDLAVAPDEEVLRLWQGLGYYSRARNLIKCARVIVDKYNEKFPEKYSELLTLPGIGKYTAAAIASFAFHEKVAVVDGNVYRVLSRLFGIEKDISDSNSLEFFKTISEQFIPEGDPGLYNQALMELGATVCIPRTPDCNFCPLNNLCFAYQHKVQQLFPVKTKKVKVRERKFFYILIYNEDGCLMKKRGPKDIWTEMYDFLWLNTDNLADLNFITDNKELSTLVREPDEIYGSMPVKHILSHQRLETSFIHVYNTVLPEGIIIDGQQLQYYPWEKVADLPKPVLVNDYLKKKSFIS